MYSVTIFWSIQQATMVIFLLIQQSQIIILQLIQQATMLLHYSWSNNLLPYHTPWYSKLLRYHIPIDTANHYITIPNWYSYYIITISLCNNNLLRYYIPIDTVIYHVTTLLLIQQAITILLWIQQANTLLYNPMIQHSNKFLYSNRYNKLLYSNMLLHSVINYEQSDRPPATGGPPPMRTPGAARRTPRQLPKTMNFVLLYCGFFCFAIFLQKISLI